MSARSSQLAQLRRVTQLAADRQQDAAKALADCQKMAADASAQLHQLLTFRHDYQRKAEQQTRQGMSIAQLIDTQRFMAQLDVAINQQRAIGLAREEDVQRQQLLWQETARYTNAVTTLTNQRQRAATAAEEKRLQQAVDDLFSQRANSFKRG